jgi:hypothetical protein
MDYQKKRLRQEVLRRSEDSRSFINQNPLSILIVTKSAQTILKNQMLNYTDKGILHQWIDM